ncbi:MAG: hypothetical protein FJX54_21050 [Alphaproteobacteria bacterium]|nr:hypothetical protein [Alphaproteobacteria bacterium]
MAKHRSGAWTIGEHLDQGYTLTVYCNNPRCARARRRQGRQLDLSALDPHLTLEDLQPRLACVDCGHRSAIMIRTAPEPREAEAPEERARTPR